MRADAPVRSLVLWFPDWPVTALIRDASRSEQLDASLLGWGTDFVRAGSAWSNARARGYRKGAKVKDPFQLRVNAYRVLLTRGRDATVVFVPPMVELDETYRYLVAAGVAVL